MKYIFEHWINGDFETRWLRHITRDNSRYWISDVQYILICDKTYRSKRHYKLAHKYRKMVDGSIGRSIGQLSNTDEKAKMLLSFVNPQNLKCQTSFDDIFNVDLRLIQHPDNPPLCTLFNRDKLAKKEERFAYFAPREEEYFLKDFMRERNEFSSFHIELAKYLKDFFNVQTVYELSESCFEHSKLSIIGKTITYFHIIHQDKKIISFEESQKNITIGFWLFDNYLIFRSIDGIDTW